MLSPEEMVRRFENPTKEERLLCLFEMVSIRLHRAQGRWMSSCSPENFSRMEILGKRYERIREAVLESMDLGFECTCNEIFTCEAHRG